MRKENCQKTGVKGKCTKSEDVNIFYYNTYDIYLLSLRFSKENSCSCKQRTSAYQPPEKFLFRLPLFPRVIRRLSSVEIETHIFAN